MAAHLAFEDDVLINVGQIRPTTRVNAYLLYTVNAPLWKGSNKIIAEAFKLSKNALRTSTVLDEILVLRTYWRDYLRLFKTISPIIAEKWCFH